MAAATLGKLAEIMERLKLADFVQVAVVRLGKLAMTELAMVAKVNSTGFKQTEVVRLKLDGTECVMILGQIFHSISLLTMCPLYQHLQHLPYHPFIMQHPPSTMFPPDPSPRPSRPCNFHLCTL
jgi:hypothetical protein